ncbi:MAG: hypothetical protein WC022_02690 [Parcubacteria group bacterium]
MKTMVLALLTAMAILATASFAEAKIIGEFHDLSTGEKKKVYRVEKGDTCWGIFRKLFPEEKINPNSVAKKIMQPNGILAPRKLATRTVLEVIVEKAHPLPEATVSKEMEAGKAESEKKIADLERENAELKQEATRMHKIISDLEAVLQASLQEKEEAQTILSKMEEAFEKRESRGIYISKPPLGSSILFAVGSCILVWMLYLIWYEKSAKATDVWLLSKEEAKEARNLFRTIDREVFLDEEIKRLIDGIGKEDYHECESEFFRTGDEGGDYEKCN